MKELTIEQKAQRYDKTIERAKIYYSTTDSAADTELIELLFPELKIDESEDDRVRKNCIHFLELQKQHHAATFEIEECIAWLEKQGEKESDPRYKYLEELLAADTIYQMAMNDGMVEEAKTKAIYALSKLEIGKLLGFEKKKGEQKPAECNNSTLKDKLLELFQRFRWYCKDETPTNGDIIEYVDAHIQELIGTMQKPAEWCEEDEDMIQALNACIDVVINSGMNYISFDSKSILIGKVKNWLESIKGRVQSQSKQEWSKEDEQILMGIIGYLCTHDSCELEGFDEWYDWLKSIKGRVQPQPKQDWSEKDENIILRLIDYLYGKSRLAKDREDGISWLESLKYRVQPQYITITDEELAQAKKDAYNDVLDKIEYNSENPTFDDGWSAAIWYLKKRTTQPQTTWKPSDDEMNSLKQAINSFPYETDYLDSLYEELKKLREE